MPTFKYAKLVRDKIWGFHEADGHTVIGKKLTGVELRRALCEKLHEEADEVDTALTKEQLTEELADVRQILDDLCAEEGVLEAEVKTAQAKKFAKKGGFQGGRYIEMVTIADENDKWVQYCRSSPDKYPEVVDAET